MKLKTATLVGKALSWAVAQAEYLDKAENGEHIKPWVLDRHKEGHTDPYAEEWLWAGPIIDREQIAFNQESPVLWRATIDPMEGDGLAYGYGTNHITAALRCYVEFALGDEVEIPQALAEELGLHANEPVRKRAP